MEHVAEMTNHSVRLVRPTSSDYLPTVIGLPLVATLKPYLVQPRFLSTAC